MQLLMNQDNHWWFLVFIFVLFVLLLIFDAVEKWLNKR